MEQSFLSIDMISILLIFLSFDVSANIKLPCDFVEDVTIFYPRFNQKLFVPMDLRELDSLETFDEIIRSQMSPLCFAHDLDGLACASEIVQLLHESIEPTCSHDQSHFHFEAKKLNVSFSAPDYRLPKVLPCDWTGLLKVDIFATPVEIPIAIAIAGDSGAPVKSFAQTYSYFRQTFSEACDFLILNDTPFRDEIIVKSLHQECMSKMFTAFEKGTIENCPLRESDFSTGDSIVPSIEMYGDTLLIHVRSLSGDEVEHFWHIMLAEVIPSLSVVLQVLDGLVEDDPSFLRKHSIQVVIHNAIRPWGESPLHSFYQELTKATRGVVSFVGSSSDHPGFRLPRWDYECVDEDLDRLDKASLFLQNILIPPESSLSGVEIVNRAREEAQLASSRRSHSELPSVVIQERSHDEALGRFNSKYFCDLVDSGALPYISKKECSEYGSHRRKVSGLRQVAKRIREAVKCPSVHCLNGRTKQVSVTAPDGGSSLRDQLTDGGYVGASVMVLGHGGGMVYALFLKPNSTVIEITPSSKHAEKNGAAFGLVAIAMAKQLKVRRIVCFEDSAFVVDLLDPVAIATSQEQTPLTLQPFEGDVSDVSTHCGHLLETEIKRALLSMNTL